jgi:hypothetical protein
MTLTQSYIKSQYKLLGDYAKRTLEEINDPDLVERTLVYKNLRSVVTTNNGNTLHGTGVIAQTVADILDTQAWLDFVEVDGKRTSCESFVKFLEQNGLDVKLAEFALKEQKPTHLVKFYEAKDGKRLTYSEVAKSRQQEVREVNGRLRSVFAASTKPAASSCKKPASNSIGSLMRRLSRDAETDQDKADLLRKIESGEIKPTPAFESIGWLMPRARRNAQASIAQSTPEVRSYSKLCPLTPEELVNLALEEFIENHPDPQALTNDSN